jgi:hypothetical protein
MGGSGVPAVTESAVHLVESDRLAAGRRVPASIHHRGVEVGQVAGRISDYETADTPHEPDAEVYSIATAEDQARLVYDTFLSMVCLSRRVRFKECPDLFNFQWRVLQMDDGVARRTDRNQIGDRVNDMRFTKRADRHFVMHMNKVHSNCSVFFSEQNTTTGTGAPVTLQAFPPGSLTPLIGCCDDSELLSFFQS